MDWLLAVWLACGVAGTLFWPIRYRHNMSWLDWKGVATVAPLGVLSGPFSFVLMFPL